MEELAKRGDLISRKDIFVYLHRLKKEGLIKVEGAKNNRKYISVNPIIENLENSKRTRENLFNYIIDKNKEPYIKEALEEVLRRGVKDA